jgi:hypothetical protein
MPRGNEFPDRFWRQADAVFALFDFRRYANPHSKSAFAKNTGDGSGMFAIIVSER